jgi:seryl-tRNA(Sec) selenium transferase
MAKPPSNKKKAKRSVLVGLGLDSDGHKRVTTGSNFALVGGTEETHEAMVEKAIKINEKLAARGKQLEEVSREEFDDIAHEVGLHPTARLGPGSN